MAYAEMTESELTVKMLEARQHYECVDDRGQNSEGKHWWLVRRQFDDGRTIYLYPLGSGVSLGVSSTPTDQGYREVFDYFEQPWEGWRAAFCWDGQGEPEGWNRAHRLGCHTRRRPGGGGPETEYIDPADLKR